MLLTNNVGYCILTPKAPHAGVHRHPETHSSTQDAFSAHQKNQVIYLGIDEDIWGKGLFGY